MELIKSDAAESGVVVVRLDNGLDVEVFADGHVQVTKPGAPAMFRYHFELPDFETVGLVLCTSSDVMGEDGEFSIAAIHRH